MPRQNINSGSIYESQIGYSRAVVVDDWVLVSGTTGFDYTKMEPKNGVIAQCEQAFLNIIGALSKADMTLQDVVRVMYILPNRDDFAGCWPVLQKYLGNVRPAATMIVAGLIDPRLLIEIEVTAKRATPPAIAAVGNYNGGPQG